LAALHFRELFGRAELYQLPPKVKTGVEAVSRPLQGRLLFGPDITYDELSQRFRSGARIEKVTLTREFDYQAFQEFYEAKALPLFLIGETRLLTLFTVDPVVLPQPGQTLVSLVDSTMVGALAGHLSDESGSGPET